MSKRLLYALIIIAVAVIVFIATEGRVSINLLIGTIHPPTAMALLTFMIFGIIVGFLLK